MKYFFKYIEEEASLKWKIKHEQIQQEKEKQYSELGVLEKK